MKEKLSPGEIIRRLDNILPRVEKPSRYIGAELGIRRKSWDDTSARILIAFPDVYEIASGNLGHKLIQDIVNSVDQFLAERVYSPWPDMEHQLRESGTPVYSLESYHMAGDFDLLGFSLTHELSFTNLLQIIDLAGLDLRSVNRGFPIVIAGGPAVFNPEPVAEFVDAFLLGDGEDAILQLAQSIAAHREDIDRVRGDHDAELKLKRLILSEWSGHGGGVPINGVYVPSDFKVEYKDNGEIRSIENTSGGPCVISKALVTDLDQAYWVCDPPVGHIQKISSRITVEPARGCTHGCRFCQAGMIYRPYRERSTDLLLDQARQLLENTGLSEQSFLALSATDWTDLREFIRRIKSDQKTYHLRQSLPSNRISAVDSELLELLSNNRKGGLTLAIEAGTQRLRNVINKEVTDDDVFRAIRSALESGWDLLKLYFMIGLPTETDDDVNGIISLVQGIRNLVDQMKRTGTHISGRLNIKVSVSNFIPKSHTPFQWAPMDTPENLDRKQKILTRLRKIKNVEYSSHRIDPSWVEGIMARGDRRLSVVIEEAYRLGARFDAWNDMCRYDIWRDAFRNMGIEPDWYHRGRDVDEILPWDHLSCGVDKEWLKKDWLRSAGEEMISDCNESICHVCGMHGIYKECRPMRKKAGRSPA